jgi:hypothetical protein
VGENKSHSRSKQRIARGAAVVVCALGLGAFLFLNPGRARADIGDDLQTQYQDLQKVTNANAKQITSLQVSLDNMSRRVSHASPNYQTLEKNIIDLKLKNNELFEKQSDLASQLKKFGRDPDRPSSKRASAGKTPTTRPATVDAATDDQPLQKVDGGEVASADVTKLPSNLIPDKPPVVLAKPAVVFKPQNTLSPDNTKSIASVAQPDPAVEAAVDEKVRQQKPKVDVLVKLASGEPEPPPEALAADPVMPVEPPPPQAVQTPGTDWTAIAIGTVLVGGAIAAGVAASSGGGGSGGHSSGAVRGVGGHYSPCH